MCVCVCVCVCEIIKNYFETVEKELRIKYITKKIIISSKGNKRSKRKEVCYAIKSGNKPLFFYFSCYLWQK